jgi:uncharacterized repeat protein (TIGR04042 family)
MHFHVRWPDGRETVCYSPSLVVKDYLDVGSSYALGDFVARMREALEIASERVRLKFGFACSRANDQLLEIEACARAYASAYGEVTITAFSAAD